MTRTMKMRTAVSRDQQLVVPVAASILRRVAFLLLLAEPAAALAARAVQLAASLAPLAAPAASPVVVVG